MKSNIRHPLVIKIGYLNELERENIVEICSSVGVDAIDMINTIPFGRRFPGQASPLRKGGGVCNEHDVRKFLRTGASAVVIGSAHILKPWISTQLAKRFTEAITERHARFFETPLTST